MALETPSRMRTQPAACSQDSYPPKGAGGGEELLPKRLLKEHIGGGRDSGTGNTSV